MEEQENEIHLNESSFQNNEFKTNNKRRGGRAVGVGLLFC
jgi:hypothetical protein